MLPHSLALFLGHNLRFRYPYLVWSDFTWPTTVPYYLFPCLAVQTGIICCSKLAFGKFINVKSPSLSRRQLNDLNVCVGWFLLWQWSAIWLLGSLSITYPTNICRFWSPLRSRKYWSRTQRCAFFSAVFGGSCNVWYKVQLNLDFLFPSVLLIIYHFFEYVSQKNVNGQIFLNSFQGLPIGAFLQWHTIVYVLLFCWH
jgi:hypothetical protein